MDLRNTPQFIYTPNPDAILTRLHHLELRTASPPFIHILIYARVTDGRHIAVYWSTVSQGCVQGRDRTQALSRAVHTAFHNIIPHLPSHTLIWIQDLGYLEKLLTLSPNSDDLSPLRLSTKLRIPRRRCPLGVESNVKGSSH